MQISQIFSVKVTKKKDTFFSQFIVLEASSKYYKSLDLRNFANSYCNKFFKLIIIVHSGHLII